VPAAEAGQHYVAPASISPSLQPEQTGPRLAPEAPLRWEASAFRGAAVAAAATTAADEGAAAAAAASAAAGAAAEELFSPSTSIPSGSPLWPENAASCGAAPPLNARRRRGSGIHRDGSCRGGGGGGHNGLLGGDVGDDCLSNNRSRLRDRSLCGRRVGLTGQTTAEVAHARTEATADLGQFLGAEHEQADHQNDCDLTDSKIKRHYMLLAAGRRLPPNRGQANGLQPG
jgi:hypothetical protein